MVHGGQADVLVAAAVTGDEVGAEHFVVVGRRVAVVVVPSVAVGQRGRAPVGLDFGTAWWAMSSRNACPVRAAPAVRRSGGQVAFEQAAVDGEHHDLRATRWGRRELPYGSVISSGTLSDVRVARARCRARSWPAPGRRPRWPGRRRRCLEQPAGRRPGPFARRLELAQEDLVRGVRRVGLVLVDVGVVVLVAPGSSGSADAVVGSRRSRGPRSRPVTVARDAVGRGSNSGSSGLSGTTRCRCRPW